MFPQDSFRLNRQAVLLAMISAAFPAVGYGAAGRVDFSSGDASVTGRDGTARPLAKGAVVDAGDTISTNQGRAQVRFSDGAFVSIQPQTTFRIDEYAYGGKPDGSEKGFFSLLRGAMRTVTGAIGKVNRQTYQVYTPSATIGIRGTGYIATVTNPVDTYVWEGEILLQNKGGSLVCSAGQRCIAQNQDSKPEETGEPGAGPGPDPLGGLDPCQLGTTCSQLPVSLSEPGAATTSLLQPGPNAVSLAYATDPEGIDFFAGEGVVANSTATLNAALGLESFTDQGGFTATRGSSALEDVGRDPEGIIAWGRWTNGITGGEGNFSGADLTGGEFTNAKNFHYIVGVPTPLADMEALKTGNVIASYSLIGGTRATETIRNIGSTTVGSAPTAGEMRVNFGSSRVDLTMSIPNPSGSGSYGLSASNMSISGNAFSGFGSASGPRCSGSCNADVSGFFAGANAVRAGAGYLIQTPTTDIVGVAGFSKTSESVGAPQAAGVARRAR